MSWGADQIVTDHDTRKTAERLRDAKSRFS